MEPIPGAKFVRGDLMDREVQAEIRRLLWGSEADVVVSDMAPSTTGDKNLNHDRIMVLAEEAAAVARTLLRNGGVFVCKLFNGAGEREFRESLRQDFLKVKAVKPVASKKTSPEIFYVATGFVPAHLRDNPAQNLRGRTSSEYRTLDMDTVVDNFEQLQAVKIKSPTRAPP